MFHIAIVDDDQSIHQKLEEMITSILFKYPIPFTVAHFFSGNEFLNNKNIFSLIILDIEMNDGGCILTKNSLKVHTPIIFLHIKIE
jgi:FixJ family two-component response regulator